MRASRCSLPWSVYAPIARTGPCLLHCSRVMHAVPPIGSASPHAAASPLIHPQPTIPTPLVPWQRRVLEGTASPFYYTALTFIPFEVRPWLHFPGCGCLRSPAHHLLSLEWRDARSDPWHLQRKRGQSDCGACNGLLLGSSAPGDRRCGRQTGAAGPPCNALLRPLLPFLSLTLSLLPPPKPTSS